MSAPQTPSPCPVEWCVGGPHKTATHESRDFRPDALIGIASVLITQERDRPPVIEVWKYNGADGKVIATLWDYQAHALADIFERVQPGWPLAIALREAADEIDRINGGGS